MKFRPSTDLWIVGILFVFTFVLAYISSLQPDGVCVLESSNPGIWQVTSWPIKVVLFQLLLAFLLFAFSQSRRFGAPLAYIEDEPRGQTEYVASMADLVRRSGKQTLIIETLSRQFKTELKRKLALDPAAGDHEILNALKVQHPEVEPQIRAVLQQERDFRNEAAGEQLSAVMRWAREIATIRGNWRRAS